MKIIIKGQINWRPAQWEDQVQYAHHPCDIAGWVKVKDYEIEVDIPDDFDPRSKMVEALQAERENVRANFQARITQIERQISELQAIDYTPGAA